MNQDTHSAQPEALSILSHLQEFSNASMLRQKYYVEIPELGISISTGDYGKQANGAVVIALKETSVFVSATAAKSVKKDQDFFPLSVDYKERFSAAGRFPGGYFKREGKPSEKEVLTSRLCDRPLRPLFPKGFYNEVQVIGLLLSTDLQNESDILMVNGASAALMCSDIPWNGPIGCVRIAQVNGQWIINPTNDELFESSLDLVYVGNKTDMMMIEGSADQMSDAEFVQALEVAHQAIQPIIRAQEELAAQVQKAKKNFKLLTPNTSILDTLHQKFEARLSEAIFQENKLHREEAIEAIYQEAVALFKAEFEAKTLEESQLKLAFEEILSTLYRNNILIKGKRADGRQPQELRPLLAKAGVLPRVHGSAIFQRGETQALVTTTLGNNRDSQDLDALTGGAQSKSFILHYNFPPFSVGDVGKFFGAGRREIGHGALAERSLNCVVPPETEFPYSIRLVSDVLESNGSTSMATVCGGTLALMDAGVPITAPVAGISIGLVTQNDANENISKYVLLTDIIGSEDHFGDMDFKIAGTRHGITGFQLDLKIKGLPLAIAKEAIEQNRQTRMRILDVMEATLDKPRAALKDSAPQVHQMSIPTDKIGALIGTGGKTIKKITELTGAQIDINEDNSGRLSVFAPTKQALKNAILEIERATSDIEPNKVYRGIIRSIKDFGIFVECLPGKEGLVHVSEIQEGHVNHPEDVCKIGQEIIVKCIGIDLKGRVKLSAKAAKQNR